MTDPLDWISPRHASAIVGVSPAKLGKYQITARVVDGRTMYYMPDCDRVRLERDEQSKQEAAAEKSPLVEFAAPFWLLILGSCAAVFIVLKTVYYLMRWVKNDYISIIFGIIKWSLMLLLFWLALRLINHNPLLFIFLFGIYYILKQGEESNQLLRKIAERTRNNE